jgi:hypothetical protein
MTLMLAHLDIFLASYTARGYQLGHCHYRYYYSRLQYTYSVSVVWNGKLKAQAELTRRRTRRPGLSGEGLHWTSAP